MDGEKVPLKFGMPACRYFMEKIDQEHISPLSGDSVNEVGIAYLLYAGYLNHCIIKEKVPEKTLEQFMEYVELMSDDPAAQAEMVKAGECFSLSKSVQKYVEKTEKAASEIKKKLDGMKSSLSATGNSGLTPASTQE